MAGVMDRQAAIERLARLMGWHRGIVTGTFWYFDAKDPGDDGRAAPASWDPFESVADAMMVVERISQDKGCGGYPFVLHEDRYGGSSSGGRWLASFGISADGFEYDGALGDDIQAMEYWDQDESQRSIRAGAAPAEAIARAALAWLDRMEKKP